MVPRKQQHIALAKPRDPRLIGHLIDELHGLVHDLLEHVAETSDPDVSNDPDVNIRVEATGMMHLAEAIRHASTRLTTQLREVVLPSMMANPNTTKIFKAVVLFWRGELAAVQFQMPDSGIAELIENFIMNESHDDVLREAVRVMGKHSGDPSKIIEQAEKFAKQQYRDVAVWANDNGACSWLKHGDRYSTEMLARLDGVAREELSSGGSF